MKLKRFLAQALTLVMLVGTLSPAGIPNTASVVHAEETDPATMEYEIYPIPQKVTYQEGTAVLGDTIKIKLDESLDKYTKAKAEKVVTENGYKVAGPDSTLMNPGTNLFVCLNEENDVLDYVKGKVGTYDETIMEKIDAYALIVKGKNIAIVGKDSDGAFFGLETLDLILKQLKNKTIRALKIEDYATQKTRGFIEGYYGIPWSTDNRASLMEFGGRFKANTYVFGPKDDPYLRAKWYEQYPADKLPDIKRLAELGNATKVRYVWTVSPFINETRTMWSSNYDDAKNKILQKFDSLYAVGVRQFGVFADDVGSLPLTTVTKLINDIEAWKKTKSEPIRDTIFCPGSYNFASWAYNANELNTFERDFPKNVEIFWTGDFTCGPVTQETIDHFKHGKSWESVNRRDPLFWLNWPVNDIDGKSPVYRMFMGKASMLQKGIQNLRGVVSNPMQEAQASKNAIFAIADYCWNDVKFDAQKSWEAGFRYFEPDAASALMELAKHMSNTDRMPGVQGSGDGVPGLEESVEIKTKIDAFNNAIKSGTADTAQTAATALIADYQKIIKAHDDFNRLSKNAGLKEELKPFIDSLKDLANASIKFVEASLALKKKDTAGAKTAYNAGLAFYESMSNHDVPYLKGSNIPAKKAYTSTKVLRPQVDTWKNDLETKLGGGTPASESEPFKNPDLTADNLIYSTSEKWATYKEGWNSWPVNNLMDKRDNTFTWYTHEKLGGSANKFVPGNYFGYDLKAVKKITRIRLNMGNDANNLDSDHWTDYKICYYGQDNQWHDLQTVKQGNKNHMITDLDLSDKNILGSKVVVWNLADCSSWLKVSDFMVAAQDPNAKTREVSFTITPSDATLVVTDKGGNVQNPKSGTTFDLLDGDYNWKVSKDGYISQNASFKVSEDSEKSITVTLKEGGPFVNPIITTDSVVTWRPNAYWSYEQDGYPHRLKYMFDGTDEKRVMWAVKDKLAVGDRIGYDFKELKKITKVYLSMGEPATVDDHMSEYAIAYSASNKPWDELTDADIHIIGQTIHQGDQEAVKQTYIKDLNIIARYVFILNKKDRQYWCRLGDFDVATEELPATKYDVTFTTNPSDATIVLKKDGKDEVIAPTTVGGKTYSIPIGYYTYTVSKDGYDTKTETFMVTGAMTKDVTLVLTKYNVTFTIGTPGATLRVEDMKKQVVDPVEDMRYELLPGRYTYYVSAEHYVDATQEFDVTNEDITFTIHLDKKMYGLTFTVTPDDATLVLKNSKSQVQNPTEGTVFSLPADEYTYEVEKAGFLSKTGTVTVPDTESVKVDLKEAFLQDKASGVTVRYQDGSFDTDDVHLNVLPVKEPDIVPVQGTDLTTKRFDAKAYDIFFTNADGERLTLNAEAPVVVSIPENRENTVVLRWGDSEASYVDAKNDGTHTVFTMTEVGIYGTAVLLPKETIGNVRNLKAIANGTEITLTWDAVADADGYVLYRQAPGEKEMTRFFELPSTSITEAVGNPGFYFYRVIPFRNTNQGRIEGGSVNYAFVKVILPPPAQVQNLKVRSDGMLVRISWDAVVDADGYYVYRMAPGEKNMTLYADVNVTSLPDPADATGMYYYLVQAYRNDKDGIRKGLGSKATGARVFGEYPADVQNLRIRQKMNGTLIELTWDKVKDADGYAIFRQGPNDKTFVYRYAKSGTVFQDKVDGSGLYVYKVCSFRKYGKVMQMRSTDRTIFTLVR